MTELPNDLMEFASAWSVDETIEKLSRAIEGADMTVFASIDHAHAARTVGLTMPPATVLLYGNPRGGTPIMVAAPQAALELPLRVLVRGTPEGHTIVAFRPSDGPLRRAGVPDALAGRLLPAQHLLQTALQP